MCSTEEKKTSLYMMSDKKEKILALRKSVTFLPLIAAVFYILSIDMTMFFGKAIKISSISFNGTLGLGAVFFRLSLILFLPLWAMTLLIYHSESWAMSSECSGTRDTIHILIAVVNVCSYALLVSLPVDKYETPHHIFAGAYFLTLYIHLYISWMYPQRTMQRFHFGEELQNLRGVLFLLATVQLIGLFVGDFPSFEMSGAIVSAAYIALFSVEFHIVFQSLTLSLYKKQELGLKRITLDNDNEVWCRPYHNMIKKQTADKYQKINDRSLKF